jgi:hypothetical protein
MAGPLAFRCALRVGEITIGLTTDIATKIGTPRQFKPEDQMDRRFFIATAATATFALAVPAVAQESGAKSLPEHFASTLSAHDIPSFAALFADDYVNHQVSAAARPPPLDKSPKQATVGFFAARLAGIPDLQVAVEATVASNDMVAAQCAEHWGMGDIAGVLAQLRGTHP